MTPRLSAALVSVALATSAAGAVPAMPAMPATPAPAAARAGADATPTQLPRAW